MLSKLTKRETNSTIKKIKIKIQGLKYENQMFKLSSAKSLLWIQTKTNLRKSTFLSQLCKRETTNKNYINFFLSGEVNELKKKNNYTRAEEDAPRKHQLCKNK